LTTSLARGAWSEILLRRTMGAGVGPCAHDLPESRPCPGRGRAPSSRRPRPADQGVLFEMVNETGHVPAAVTCAILDLLADLSQRAALPRHGSRRQVPFGMTRNMRRLEVARAVAGIAGQRRRAVTILAPHHQRLMEPHPVRLMRAVADRMTVDAARMHEH